MNIKECKAIVTGGSRGIGLSIGRMLKEKGAAVAITGRNQDELDEAAGKIKAVAIKADVRIEDDCRRSIKEAADALDGLNVLINNAGIGYGSPIESFDAKAFEDVWSTNVMGAAFMAREAAHIFMDQKYGTIVNMGSSSALRGYENASAYVASKFALRGMTECWRAELRRYNIRVILINPSEVQTGFGRRTVSNINPKKLVDEDVAHTVLSCLTMEDRGFIPEVSIWATNPW